MTLKKYSQKIMSLLVIILTLGQLNVAQVALASENNDDKISVVASFYPMYEFARQVGGDRIDLSLMVSGNASPHGYEPTANNIIEVNNSDVFIYSSDAMEYWAETLLSNVNNDDLLVIRASDTEADGHGHSDHDHAESTDLNEDQENHDDHDHNQVEIIGLADHYHTGDVITLQANATEAVSEWEWQVRKPGEEWQVVEGQTTNVFEYAASKSSLEVQAIGQLSASEDTIESEIIEAHVDNHDDLDPHSWLDPVLAQAQVNTIRDAFIQADPEGEAEYTANAEAFNQELESLNGDYENAFKDATHRSFVVQHEAFGYLANRYNIEQISVGGLSTEVEPSPARIGEITKIIRETGATIIYYQQGGNSSIAQTISLEAGVDIVELYDLEMAPTDQSLTYIEAMQKNLQALKLSIK